ncbi:molybdopterin-dependent oxidoreductase [Nakamurella lactea]|uniref:molybdopterin-dependent oxidoreductase n=1 Tax=Nakamurella lactea TaxID=459515 RepID=UPI0003FD1185|nr:molybdopterin-dependent oxidoreductase [Nakamurella lactea]
MDNTTSTPRRSARRPGLPLAALIGVVAVGLALGVAELLAALGGWFGWWGVSTSPVVSLGSTFISLTPEWLKEFAIRTFGQHDKDALLAGMGITFLLIATIVGVIGRSRPRWAAGILAAGVIAAAIAVLLRPATGIVDVLPTVLGGAAGIAFLVSALRRALNCPLPNATHPGADPAERSTPADGLAGSPRSAITPQSNRRGFVRLIGLGALAAATAGALSRWIPSTEQVTASRAGIVLPTAADLQPAPTVDLKTPGLTPFLTTNADFYRVDTAFAVPRITAQDWRLRVHGMVSHPFEIDFAELTAMTLVQRTITLSCVSNEVGGNLNGTATWVGARMADILGRARPQPGADCVLSTSVDSFTVSTPLAALTDGRDALLAVGMNGDPLPLEHGFPVRMVVPGLFGYVSATKWVVDLEVTTFSAVNAYWTKRGWSANGPIKTESRIDIPRGFAQLKTGPVPIAGVAWAQHRGITAVHVQIDDGSWLPATLSAPFSIDTWRQWVYLWNATPGEHTIRCRATDATGTTQTSAAAPIMPDGATGYDSRVVTVNP